MVKENEELREQVLQGCRGLAAYGLGSGLGGHVSVRYPDEPYFYMHVFERTFEEMQLEDIILIDFDGNPVNSNRAPASESIFTRPSTRSARMFSLLSILTASGSPPRRHSPVRRGYSPMYRQCSTNGPP